MQPASNSTVVENVLQQIRNAISSGRFRSGDRLPSEFELMKELNVSRNSLREAMKILSAIGVVEIRRGDGTYVCNEVKPSFIDTISYSVLLESSSAEELIEFRQTLDEDVLHMAVRRATDEDIRQLQEYINQMRAKFNDGEIGAAAKYDYLSTSIWLSVPGIGCWSAWYWVSTVCLSVPSRKTSGLKSFLPRLTSTTRPCWTVSSSVMRARLKRLLPKPSLPGAKTLKQRLVSNQQTPYVQYRNR